MADKINIRKREAVWLTAKFGTIQKIWEKLKKE